jgi:catechol 2,3-dioxygenase-like lactoylglutathione lyase family enzyme
LYEAIHRLDVPYTSSGQRKDAALINGAHTILYSDDADATRATLAKVLGTRSVDTGGGWLIFALPPAELAVHPADQGGRAELYLMTDDVAATVAALQTEGVEIARPISDQGWGLLTAITLPGGVELGLYQPRHPTAAGPS